uniref:Uncharacterized protein n=1 Tax=Medicago truncatula TaxID=3880 RepID=Q1SN21_MEDTR|nr:hypothetical protein MtrDRAFT_AC139526g1v2 [Medicago truncatula]
MRKEEALEEEAGSESTTTAANVEHSLNNNRFGVGSPSVAKLCAGGN